MKTFEEICEKFLVIKNPKEGNLIPFKLLSHQKDLYESLNNNNFTIINQYRQGGFTTLILAYLAYQMVTNKITLCLVSNNVNLSQNCLLKPLTKFIELLSNEFNVKILIDNKNEKKLSNGSVVYITSATSNPLRSFNYDYLYLNDAAFFQKNGKNLYSQFLPQMNINGKIIIGSVPNGVDNLFYEISKSNSYKYIEAKWYNDERYNKNLEWYKPSDNIDTPYIIEFNKEKQSELIKLGYKPTSTWYREQCKMLNYDYNRIDQELNNKFIKKNNKPKNMKTLLEPILTNRFQLKFPESLNIPSDLIQNVNKPKLEIINGVSQWYNLDINILNVIGPSIPQRIFDLIEYVKKEKNNKNTLTLELNDLDPTGIEISKWIINIEEIILVDFGECDLNNGQYNLIKIIMKIHSVTIEY